MPRKYSIKHYTLIFKKTTNINYYLLHHFFIPKTAFMDL